MLETILKKHNNYKKMYMTESDITSINREICAYDCKRIFNIDDLKFILNYFSTMDDISIDENEINKIIYLFFCYYKLRNRNIRFKKESEWDTIYYSIIDHVFSNKKIKLKLLVNYYNDVLHSYCSNEDMEFILEEAKDDLFHENLRFIFDSNLNNRNLEKIEIVLKYLNQDDINNLFDVSALFSNSTFNVKQGQYRFCAGNQYEILQYINYNHPKIIIAKKNIVEKLKSINNKIVYHSNSYFFCSIFLFCVFHFQNDKQLLDTFLSFIKNNCRVEKASCHVHLPDVFSVSVLNDIADSIFESSNITCAHGINIKDYGTKVSIPIGDYSYQELKEKYENDDQKLINAFKKSNVNDYEL